MKAQNSYDRARCPRRAEKASTLLTVLCLILVVSILVLAYMNMVVQRARAIARSQSWNLCVPVAEAGIEEAMAHLNQTRGRNLATNGWDYIGSDKYLKIYTDLGLGRYSVQISNASPPVFETRGSVEVLGTMKVPGTTGGEVSRSFLVTTLYRPGVEGIVTQTKATLKNSAHADSYNSAVAPYDPLNPGDNTFIGNISSSPSQLEVSGDVKIFGEVGTGAPGGLKIDKPAMIGDARYVSDPANAGQVQPGHYSSGLDVPIAPITSPPFSGGSGLSGGKVDGTSHTYVLGGGNFKVDGTLTLESSQTMIVTGNANLWVTDTMTVKDLAQVIIAPDATLTVYIDKQFYAIGNAQINAAGRPQQLSYNGMSSNAEFYMNDSTKFVGTVYSPQAKIDISGNAQFFGGGRCNELVLQGSARFHYDESLANQTEQPFTITSWQEL